jgi:hypothetical protein
MRSLHVLDERRSPGFPQQLAARHQHVDVLDEAHPGFGSHDAVTLASMRRPPHAVSGGANDGAWRRDKAASRLEKRRDHRAAWKR